MSNLVIANIVHRPTRTLISIFAVALGVILVITAVGLSRGELNDVVARTQNVGADIIFQPTGASLLFALNTGTMNLRIMNRIREVPGVKLATPILIHFSMRDFGLIFGIDSDTFNEFPGRLQLVEGAPFTNRDDVLIDETYAKVGKLKVGDSLEIISGNRFRVAGIVRSGLAVVRVFIPLKTMQEIKGVPNQISMIFLKCDSPQLVNKVVDDLKRVFKGYTINKSEDLFSLVSSNLPGLRPFILTVMALSTLISFLVILLAMYTTILERTREVGILKALGASKFFIISQILKESLLICILGISLGFGLAYIVKEIVIATFPTLQIDISLELLVRAGFLSIVSGTVGALYPAYKAARQDPVQALMYE